MSNYDPYESEDSYYSPETHANSEQSITSVAGELKSAVMGMAGFAVTHFVVSKAVGVMSKTVTRAANTVGLRRIATGNLTSKQEEIAKRLVGSNNIFDVATSRMPKLHNLSKQIQQKNASTKAILDARHAEIEAVRSASGSIDAGLARFRTAFKDPRTTAAVVGHNIFKTVVHGSMIGYGYDMATGHLESMGVKSDIPLWNLPGHALNYGQYMVKNAGAMFALGNIGLGASLVGSRLGLAARHTADNNQGFSQLVLGFADKISNFNVKGVMKGKGDGIYSEGAQSFQRKINDSIISRGIDDVKAGFSAITETLEPKIRSAMYETANHDTSTIGAISRPVGEAFYENVKNTLNQVKESFEIKRQARQTRQSYGATGLDIFSSLETEMKRQGKSETGEGMMSLMKDMTVNRRNNQSVFAQIFRLEKTKVKDVVTNDFMQEYVGGLSDKYAISDREQLAEMFGNVHLGDHFYKKGPFNVDMNRLNPINVMKRAAHGLAKMNFHLINKMPVVGKMISFNAIAMADQLLGHDLKAFNLNERGDSSGFIVRHRENGKRYQIADLLRDEGLNRDNVGVHFINDRWYAFEGSKITQLNTYNQIIRSTSPSLTGPNEMQMSERQRYMHDHGQPSVGGKAAGMLYGYQQNERKNRFSGGILGKISGAFDWEHVGAANVIQGLKNIMSDNITHNGVVGDYTTKGYQQLIETLSGKEIVGSSDKRMHISALKEMMDLSEQGVATTLKNPRVFARLKHHSKGFLTGDGGYLHDEMLLSDIARHRVDALSPTLLNNQETKILENTIVYNPKSAKSTIFKQKNGRYSQLSVADAYSTRITEAMSFQSVSGDADNIIHPFLQAADELFKEGVLSHSEKMNMSIYALTKTAFRNNKVGFSGTGLTGQYEANELHNIFKRHQQAGLFSMAEMSEFIRRPELKAVSRNSTSSTSRFEKLLELDSNEYAKGIFRPNTNSFIGFNYIHDDERSLSIALGVADIATSRLTKLVGDTFGLQRDPFKYGNGVLGGFKFLTTRAAQVGALAFAYKAIDATVATNPMFDQTSLDAGITGAVASTIAGTHLVTSAALNMTGLAGAGRYLDGLMPGFVSSAPGAVAGAALRFGKGPLPMLGAAVQGAIYNRILAPYMPDFTKTYDQLKAEYSGDEEVAMMSNRGWLLGTTPIQGNKVVGWKPNWYVEQQSRWKASDTLYGSEARKLLHEPLPGIGISFGDFVDPYYMERKHYFDRPYPTTGGFQENMPFGLGSLTTGVLGPLFKPNKRMHEEWLKGSNGGELTEVSAMPIPAYHEQRSFMHFNSPMNPRRGHIRSNFMGAYTYGGSPLYGQNIADDYLRSLEDAGGIIGFSGNVGRTALVDKSRFYPTLETAGRMSSIARAFGDANLGGMGTFTEGIRRFINKPDYKRYGINPIPNMLPNWLPERYLTGDPYAKITKGELRLPGTAYERTHNVKYTLPGRASMLGGNVRDIVSYFTGFQSPLLKEEMEILEEGTYIHAGIQQWLKSENILISAENFVYDVKNDISGHIDAIIRDGNSGGGRRALEIKSISKNGLEKLRGAKHEHVSQLNFYLNTTGMQKGSILYVDRENTANFRIFEIEQDAERYTKDLEKLQKARSIASQMLTKGKQGMARGFAYSWVDRMNILADVAPASKEYKEARSVAMKQMSNGLLTEADISKFRKSEKHRDARLRTAELYPTRFKGQIMSPDEEYNRQNINENIKAGSEYTLPERWVGAAWENLLASDSVTVNKFLAFKDPLDHYKQYKLYGKEFTPWTDPYGSFIEPRINRMRGADNPIAGAMAGGLDVGYLFGGGPMAVAGGILGGVTGTFNMLFNKDRSWLPDKVEKERKINDYFDTLNYYKNQRMASLSEGLESERYRNQANQTFFALMQQDRMDYTNIYRAAYSSERPYISAWLNETDLDKQQDILKSVPERLAYVLKEHWQQEGSKINTDLIVNKTTENMLSSRGNPTYDMRILDPSLQTEDIKLKAINNEAMNAHDFGLGWGAQMVRVQNQLGSLPNVNYEDYDVNEDLTTLSPGSIRSAIFGLFSKFGIQGRAQVYINNHVQGGSNKLNITVQHNRLQDIRDAVDFREKYF